MEKTRWYKEWINGIVGQGANVTYYQNADHSFSFAGYSRLDFPPKGEAWKNLQVGETILTICGSVWERIK